MKKDATELVFILDRSGSMSGLEEDTIGGFNSLIQKQKKEEGEAMVSCVLFSSESRVVYNRVPVEKVRKMTEREYSVGGCTALLDAVGDAVRHIEKVHGLLGKDNVPGKTLFVITTDGLENASRRYDYEKVKKMIERRTEEGWEFIFLGANMDAVGAASRIGIRRENAVRYENDREGVSVNYQVLSEAISDFRQQSASCARMPVGWGSEIEKDYRKRGGRK